MYRTPTQTTTGPYQGEQRTCALAVNIRAAFYLVLSDAVHE